MKVGSIGAISLFVLLASPTLGQTNNGRSGSKPMARGDYVRCQFSGEQEEMWLQTPRLEAIKLQVIKHVNRLGPSDFNNQEKMATDQTRDELERKVESAASKNDIMKVIDQAEIVEGKKNELRGEAETSQVTNDHPPPEDVACSQSILSFRETSDAFGKRIAGTYVAVQVVVRNMNKDFEFVLHDVQVAALLHNLDGHFRAGREKLIARGVAIKGQSLDPRNMLMGGLDTFSATISAASTIASTDFKNFANIFTAFLPPLKRWFPDYTTDQMNRLSDLGFSASSSYKIIVPRNGSVPIVTFIPQEIFAKRSKHWVSQDFNHAANTTSVIVSGAHVQEVNTQRPMLTEMKCEEANGVLDLSKSKEGNFVCSLKGSNLNLVQKIRLKIDDSRNSSSAEGEVRVTDQKAAEGQVTFNEQELRQLPEPKYAAYLLSNGDELHTGLTVNLANPVLTMAPPTFSIQGCTDNKCSLRVSGQHLDKVTKIGFATKDGETNPPIQCDFATSSQAVGTITCDLSKSQLKAGKYFLVLITKDNGKIATGKQVEVN